MANENQNPQRFARQRILSKTEAAALGYQSQGSYPSGLKNVRSYALRSALYFASLQTNTEAQLFSAGLAGSNKWDTNVLTSNSIPNGQALLVHEIRFNLTTPYTAPATSGAPTPAPMPTDLVNARASFMRNCVFQFGRENAQWDAQFLGSEVLPAVFGTLDGTIGTGEAAPVRVGDFIRPDASFRLRVPVVVGQNTSFNMTANIRQGLGANNVLVSTGSDMVVQLKGILTKAAAV